MAVAGTLGWQAGPLGSGGTGVAAAGAVAGTLVGACSGSGVGATLADGPAQAASSSVATIAKLLIRLN